MIYTPTAVNGVMIIDLEPERDNRGFFARSFCATEFADHGLNSTVVQSNIAYNITRGTVRGLHRQAPPYAEAKLVRCTRGTIADVAVDVRPESSTYGKYVMVQLSADNHRAVFIPPYVAHGFQTLTDNAEVLYHASGPYAPAGEEGFRWNDPSFGIEWLLPVTVISEQDANWPLMESLRSTAS